MARATHAGAQSGDVACKITGNQKIALQILGQMRRVNNLDDHRLDFRAANLHCTAPVAANDLLAGHHARQQFADAGAVAFNKGLAPVAKRKAPRIAAAGGAPMCVQLAAQRAEPPRAVFIESANAPRRLHAREAVQALAEKQFTAGAPCEGVNVLMRVTGAEAGEEHISFVGLAVAVGVAHVNEVAPVADVRTAMAQRKTGGHVQAISIGGNFVRLAVALCVLENEQLVVRFLARLELRIGPRA